MDAAVAFWEGLLERPIRYRGLLNRPYLGQSVGYPGVNIEAVFIDLPGGVALELLDYKLDDRGQASSESKSNGHVHLCLLVADAEAVWKRAVELGARPRNPDGPVDVDAGPNLGARVAYLRVHDEISVEIYQPAPVAA